MLQPEIASDYQAAVEITEQMNAFKEESEQLLVTWSEPVSYTHLDVYKRQGQWLPA